MLVLGLVIHPPFRGRKRKPVPDVGDLLGPSAVGVGVVGTATEPFDEGPHLEELPLDQSRVVRHVERSLGARAQLALELFDLKVARWLCHEGDVAPTVVFNGRQRRVDLLNALADVGSLLMEHLLKAGDLSQRVLVQKVTELGLEARQIICAQTIEQLDVANERVERRVQLLGFGRKLGREVLHPTDELRLEALDPLIGRIDFTGEALPRRRLRVNELPHPPGLLGEHFGEEQPDARFHHVRCGLISLNRAFNITRAVELGGEFVTFVLSLDNLVVDAADPPLGVDDCSLGPLIGTHSVGALRLQLVQAVRRGEQGLTSLLQLADRRRYSVPIDVAERARLQPGQGFSNGIR